MSGFCMFYWVLADHCCIRKILIPSPAIYKWGISGFKNFNTFHSDMDFDLIGKIVSWSIIILLRASWLYNYQFRTNLQLRRWELWFDLPLAEHLSWIHSAMLRLWLIWGRISIFMLSWAKATTKISISMARVSASASSTLNLPWQIDFPLGDVWLGDRNNQPVRTKHEFSLNLRLKLTLSYKDSFH